MSRAATDWAWSLAVKPATLKLLLLSLADRADEYHQCFPSIARLEKDTGLNRKTIVQNIKKLVEMGILNDTGYRRGQTQQVKVYQLNLNSTENGTVPKTEQYRNYRERVPFLPDNSTENGTQNQSLTSQEPINTPLTPQGEKTSRREKSKNAKFEPLSYLIAFGVSREIGTDWLKLRKSKHAPPTLTAIKAIEKEAAKANWTLERALEECCANGWQGFKAEWVNQRGKENAKTFTASRKSNSEQPRKDPLGRWLDRYQAIEAQRQPEAIDGEVVGNGIIPLAKRVDDQLR